ncbi:flagellar hook assembly protein FlgD [Oceanobacillus locisalsi]|uniref:Flagellar hook assembly protein FlgD n=1 Tax=Oceanobacillus locisalsi TaxID=546107 RepID=A0ABW3NIZ6_9BACI
MPSIDSSLYISNQQNERKPSAELGKDEFLELLVTQMQNQDPMNSMDESEFIAQMATFSSLEQMMNMSQSMDLLVNNQLVSPAIQYSHMIGETVNYRTFDEDTGEETGMESDEIMSVSEQEGWAVFHLESGKKIYADSVVEVGTAEEAAGESENDSTDPVGEEEGEE